MSGEVGLRVHGGGESRGLESCGLCALRVERDLVPGGREFRVLLQWTSGVFMAWWWCWQLRPCLSPHLQMPRLWLDYCQFLMDQGRVTHTRRTFDRALRALPITQHSRIWPLYLRFLRSHPLPETAVRGYRRFLKVSPSVGEMGPGSGRWASSPRSRLSKNWLVGTLSALTDRIWEQGFLRQSFVCEFCV